MNRTNVIYSLLLVCFCLTGVSYGQTMEKEMAVQYESPVLIQQGQVTVTLADFVAYLDWRVPEEDQRGVLASPSRIEGLLESIVLMEGFLHRMRETGALDDPHVQAGLYQATARQARTMYRQRLIRELELDSYETQARELYMVEPERFISLETIDFDHILIAVDETRDAVSAMRRAADAYDALADGQPFEDVAATYSDDPGFQEHRGKFENVPLESLVPAVSEAAEALDVGELSVPVQSRFGWHVFRLTSVNDAEQMSWEEARPIAEEIARERHLSQAYERRLREINNAPMQFADGAVKTILDHYGIEGFDMSIPDSGDGSAPN